MTLLLLAMTLAGCKSGTIVLDDSGGIDRGTGADADGDGWAESVDCDDGDASVHPQADETCDGVDQDCDGAVDEEPVDGVEVWVDADGDGYGEEGSLTTACALGEGYSDQAGDCDDGLAEVNPDGVEVCDDADVDEDCDGAADDDDDDVERSSRGRWYLDADGDGYGDPEEKVRACEQPEGYVADNSDCDDEDASRNPAEGCEGEWDGRWSGPLVIEATLGDWGSDTCKGKGRVDLEEGEEPELQGELTCSFSGTFAGAGEQSFKLEGELHDDRDLSGVLYNDYLGEVEWEGGIEREEILIGAFSGSGSIWGIGLRYEGVFELER